MAPVYKLTYFNLRGLGETARYLLNYGGFEFEDIRVATEDWPQLKDKTPFGQLPTLEHNGKTVSQSLAIARYLAKQVKLAGNNDWEDLEIDAIVDTINDLRMKITGIFPEKDETKKKALVESLKDSLSYTLPRLEALAQKSNGYLAVGRLTWADFFFTTISPLFDMAVEEDTLAKCPTLKADRERVNALPTIKKWIEIRPKTNY